MTTTTAKNSFEFIRTTTYRYPRVQVTPTLVGNTSALIIGDIEVKEFTIEWVKGSRIREVIEEVLPQSEPGDFFMDGEPSVDRTISEGHDLWNISFRATRFLPSPNAVKSRGRLLINGA